MDSHLPIHSLKIKAEVDINTIADFIRGFGDKRIYIIARSYHWIDLVILPYKTSRELTWKRLSPIMRCPYLLKGIGLCIASGLTWKMNHRFQVNKLGFGQTGYMYMSIEVWSVNNCRQCCSTSSLCIREKIMLDSLLFLSPKSPRMNQVDRPYQ